ncbi:hypothetical protein BGZ74_005613 [Mortierella antarctica]|nr:hypothetical protein BGZ74_005613 [Mortierella antarctica]KAG0344656.1 hypothetical protein BG005_001744 [Podila minutissima]
MAASSHRDYCCCCIPLRFAVLIISIIALGLGGLSLWSVLHAGMTDQIPKIAAYIAAGVYFLLGLAGLFAVLFKRYGLAKNFSVLWWTVTIVVTCLSIASVVLLATRERDEVEFLCRTELLTDNAKYPGGKYDPATLAEDVSHCYRSVMIIAGASLGAQVLIMAICGWVASRYTSEVKHRKDLGQTIFGYGPVVQSPPAPGQQQGYPYYAKV